MWQSGVRECLGSNKDNASSNHSSHGWSLKYPFPKGMWRTINEDMCHCAEKKEEANNKWKRIALEERKKNSLTFYVVKLPRVVLLSKHPMLETVWVQNAVQCHNLFFLTNGERCSSVAHYQKWNVIQVHLSW